MSETVGVTLHAAERTDISLRQGPFTINLTFPGRMVPGHVDHGYGPLAVVAESLLEPGTYIPMHEHRNEEIVSWVPDGVMRHDDPTVGALVTDSEHLLVMNAGRSFWHEERTLRDDPPLRTLQIFVRPHSLGLDPKVQHGRIEEPVPNEWRHLFGPEGSNAPCFVRNEVDLYDVRLDGGASVDLPSIDGRDTYVYVFTGRVEVDDAEFGEAETGLLVDETGPTVRTIEESLVVAFLIDPDATITCRGTVGR